ncbi:MAG: hypothetical protein LBQ50_03085 [Planctomycetaceae bacterium]|nr:hypothetical protein [Planctomycetaceae bacterium]
MKRFVITIVVLFIGFEVLAEPLAQTEAEIQKCLEKRVTISITENTTFAGLFAILNEHGIQAEIDPKGAGALGVLQSSPVVRENFTIRDIPLRRLLRLILDEYDLTYIIDEGFLLITSQEEANKYRKVKVYEVADLVRNTDFKPGKKVWIRFPGFGGNFGGVGVSVMAEVPECLTKEEVGYVGNFGGVSGASPTPSSQSGHWTEMQEYDFSELMDLIECIISPDSWDEGAEMMEFYPGLCLVVYQTDEIHEKIEQLLNELRTKVAERNKTKTVPISKPKRKPTLLLRR